MTDWFTRSNRNAAIIVVVIFFVSCQQYKKNNLHQDTSDESIERGEQLAAIYCKSCHLLPDPSSLDAKSWEMGVLPSMGPRLGIFNYGFMTYPSYRFDKNLEKNFYPTQPLLSSVQWQNILDYYTALSPDSLLAGKNDLPIDTGFSLFKIEPPTYNYEYGPKISFVGIDTVMLPRTLLICDAGKDDIKRICNQLIPVDSVRGHWPVTDIDVKNGKAVACNIGVMIPNNGRSGAANRLMLNAEGKMEYDSVPMFDSLRRPVQIEICDLNKDGSDDYLVCEYGNVIGELSWIENPGGNKFTKHIIKEAPGPIKVWVQDYNSDGLPDVYALFAQGDEAIFLYTNKGNGRFEEKQLLRFPPVYGSSYFELTDFNGDGFNDILYTCGDNADFSQVLKPYHGVYIFINDGKNAYAQKYFFHINGCFKAMARDFDNDGDQDIAAISFFADYQHRPEEGFVYLENKGAFSFDAYTLPQTKEARWLTMDAGDLDGDGRIDIVLGNFSAPSMIKSPFNFEKSPPFLVLKNTGK